MRRAILAALVVIVVLAVGVGAVAYYGSYQPPAGSPTVSVTSPTAGATVSDTFTVTVATGSFNIPTQGHIHVYLDSASNYQFGNGPTFTFTNVAPGTHTIWAQLQNPDHSPLSPPVETQPITIIVESGSGSSPTVSIVSPASGAAVQGTTVAVTVSSTGFSIPAQGSYRVYLDTAYLAGNGPTFTFTNVAPGTHMIWAQLYKTDGTPVSPAVVSPVRTITITSGGTAPAVSITSPSSGATVSDTFSVTVSSTNFNVPGQGHYHVYLDGLASTEKMAFGQVSTVTFDDISPGAHTITVRLANPDHTDLQPLVSQTITVNVEQSGGNAPSISIASPTSGAVVQGPAVTVTVSSSNFQVPSQGRYLVTLSNGGSITGNGPTFTFPSVTSGAHTITAELRDANGMPLSPAVSKTVTITVTGGIGGGGGY